MFINSMKTAVIPKNNHFYLHSHNGRGLCVANGTSVLLKFKDNFEFERYIQVICLTYRGKDNAYFQLYFIQFNIDPEIQLYVNSVFS